MYRHLRGSHPGCLVEATITAESQSHHSKQLALHNSPFILTGGTVDFCLISENLCESQMFEINDIQNPEMISDSTYTRTLHACMFLL